MRKETITNGVAFILGIIVCLFFSSNFYNKREKASQDLIEACWNLHDSWDISLSDSLQTTAINQYKEAEYNYRKTFHLFEDCADDGSDFTWKDFF